MLYSLLRYSDTYSPPAPYPRSYRMSEIPFVRTLTFLFASNPNISCTYSQGRNIFSFEQNGTPGQGGSEGNDKLWANFRPEGKWSFLEGKRPVMALGSKFILRVCSGILNTSDQKGISHWHVQNIC